MWLFASLIIRHSHIKSSQDSTCSKRWVDCDIVEGGLCTFLSWEERKEIRKENKRNHRLFANKANTTVQLLKKVKMYSLRWLKTKNVSFPFGHHMWWQHPLVCLEIDWCFIFHLWPHYSGLFDVTLFCFFRHSLC